MRSSSHNLRVGVASLLLLCGCAPQVAPERGLPVAVYDATRPVIAQNTRGEWFVVLPHRAPVQAWVQVRVDDDVRLFWARREAGRVAALWPISPAPDAWMQRAALGARVRLLEDVRDARPSRALGLWRPGEPLRWLGASMPGAVVSLLPVVMQDAPEFLHARVAGVAQVQPDGALTTVEPAWALPKTGLYLALPEALAPEEARAPLQLVNLANAFAPLSEDPQWEVRDAKRALPEVARLDAATLTAIGREEGADLLVYRMREQWFIASTEPEIPLPDAQRARPEPSAWAVSWSVLEPGELARAARALAHLRAGRPLAAQALLHRANARADDDGAASRWRLMELAGAADRAAWTHRALTHGRAALRAPELLYLAKTYALEGSYEVALRWSRDAEQAFNVYPAPALMLGQGRATLTSAQALAGLDRFQEAADTGALAATILRDAPDPLQASRAEARASVWATRAGDETQALALAKRARSRAYHGGAAHLSGARELEFAALLDGQGLTRDASAMRLSAYNRAQRAGDPFLAARAHAADALRILRARPDLDALTRAQRSFDATLRDPVTRAIAAAALLEAPSLPEPEDNATLGKALWRGRAWLNASLYHDEVTRALRTSCALGLGASRPALAPTCAELLRAHAIDEAEHTRWLARAWSALQLGREEQTRALYEALSQVTIEPLSPQARTQHALWCASAAQALTLSDPQRHLDRARDLIASLDADARAPLALSLAQDLAARGQPQLAASLAAFAAAQGRDTFATSARLLQLELLAEGAAWAELAQAASAPTRADALSQRAPVLARLYLAHAQARLGDAEAAQMTHERARALARELDPQDQIEVATRDATLALSRGLAPTLSRAAPGARQRGLARALEARLALRQGARERALALAREAAETLTDDPHPDARVAHADALLVWGLSAWHDSQTRRVDREFAALRAQVGADAPLSLGLIPGMRARARWAFVRGDLSLAAQTLEELAQAGFAADPWSLASGCARAPMLWMLPRALERAREATRQCLASRAPAPVRREVRAIAALAAPDPVDPERRIAALEAIWGDSDDAHDATRLALARAPVAEISLPRDLAAPLDRVSALLVEGRRQDALLALTRLSGAPDGARAALTLATMLQSVRPLLAPRAPLTPLVSDPADSASQASAARWHALSIVRALLLGQRVLAAHHLHAAQAFAQQSRDSALLAHLDALATTHALSPIAGTTP